MIIIRLSLLTVCVTAKSSISIRKHRKENATSQDFRRIPQNSATTLIHQCKSTVETANTICEEWNVVSPCNKSRPRVYLVMPLMILIVVISNCSKSRPSANIVCINFIGVTKLPITTTTISSRILIILFTMRIGKKKVDYAL
jgi:hypothetical protein